MSDSSVKPGSRVPVGVVPPDAVSELGPVGHLRKWRHSVREARRDRRPTDGRDRSHLRWSLSPIERPVFILGCPRSGTTYLGDVLSTLPDVTYFFEPPALKYFSRLVYEGSVSEPLARRYYRLGLRTLRAAAPGEGPRVIEKNPTHTWIAQELLSFFPDASFITIGRDGRDVALSLVEKPWHRRDGLAHREREPGGYLYGPYPHFYIEPGREAEYTLASDIRRCAWIWRRFTEETERLRTALPSTRQLHLRYEDLIQSPGDVLGDLLAFLGYGDALSRARVLDAARSGKATSIGRWREGLAADALAEVEEEAGEMLRLLEYS